MYPYILLDMGMPFATGADDACCPDTPEAGDSCDTPIFAEICNIDDFPVGIEASLAPLGCTLDTDGLIAGKVFLCKVVDEETGVETYTPKYIAAGSSSVVDYDAATHGNWGPCPIETTCAPIGSVGTIAAWGDVSA